MELMAAGKSNKCIAYDLSINEVTVKAHVSNILKKLDVTNRVMAVVAYLKHVNPEMKIKHEEQSSIVGAA
jgi:DNA-binding NarL/FixJ family response regulator